MILAAAALVMALAAVARPAAPARALPRRPTSLPPEDLVATLGSPHLLTRSRGNQIRWGIGVGGGMTLAVVWDWRGAAATFAVALLGLRWQHPRRLRLAVEHIDSALPDAIELIVLAVRSGRLPAAALASIRSHVPPPIAEAFTEVERRVSGGRRFADALAALPELLGPAAEPLADSLAAADRYGLPLAPVLDRLAADARAHRRRLTDARLRALPVRLAVPLVLCTLPAYVLLAIVPLLLGALSSLHR